MRKMKKWDWVILALICLFILIGCGHTTPDDHTLTYSGVKADNPECREIREGDIRDEQFTKDTNDNMVTVITLTDWTPIVLDGWVKFEEGWYVYDATYPVGIEFTVPGKFVESEQSCPIKAKIIK